jgi:iron(III) transport system substrate-binding protein
MKMMKTPTLPLPPWRKRLGVREPVQAWRVALLMALWLGLAACGGASPTVSPSSAAGASSANAASAKPAGSAAAAASSGGASAKPAGSAAAAASSGGASAKPAASAAAAAAKPSPLSAAEQALVDAAKKEGRPTLYSVSDPDLTQNMMNAFKARYGLDVDVQRLGAGPLGQRYSAEADAGKVVADAVVVSDVVFMDEAINKGWLAKIDSLPSLPDWPKDQWNGYYAPVNMAFYTIAYNTKMVKESDAPKTWTELTDPKWKGQLLQSDPRISLGLTQWLYLMRQSYGDDFFKKLMANNPRLVTSSVPATQQLAAGAASIFFPEVHSVVLSNLAQGAPLAETFPDLVPQSGTLAGVSAKAPHPNAGRLLLNFYLSKEGQTILNKDGWSVMPDVPGTRPLPKNITNVEPKVATAAKDQLFGLIGISA